MEAATQTILGSARRGSGRDRPGLSHSEMVGRDCSRTARALGMDEQDVARLRLAGNLHDIGKVDVPQSVLAQGTPLSHKDWTMVRQHPELGARLLAGPEFHDIRAWILCHHERIDGQGYPLGLSGEQIPLPSRIISVVDSYHAMTSDRTYHRAMSREEAYAELRMNAGTQFDPEVVEAFIACLEAGG